MNPNNGGPAFPSPQFAVPSDMRDDLIVKLRDMQGMTLRDYFAAKAMEAIISGGHPIVFEHDTERKTAVAAYTIADAMLKERCEP